MELKAQRYELHSQLAPSAPLDRPETYSREALERFCARLRDVFLSDDRAVAKTYVRALVESVVVNEDSLQLVA